jgi:Flp pilus assembly protein TadG
MQTRITLPGRKPRILADRRGAAALEFALLLPLLTVMITGVWQYGTLYYAHNVMTNAARNGARALAVNSATETQVVANVKASMPSWIPDDVVNVVAKNTTSTGTANVSTRITIPAASATMFSLGPMPDDIEAFVTMERET